MNLASVAAVFRTIGTGLTLAVSTVSLFFAPVAPVFCGIALAVISFRQYAYQREVLKGANKNTAIAVGYSHIMMCSTIGVSLLFIAANPLFAPMLPFIGVACGVGIGISLLSALCAGGYAKLQKDWKQSGIRPLQFIIKSIDYFLGLLPARITSALGKFFGRLHHWLGTFFFNAQLALFCVLAGLVQPALGIAALSYLSLNFLRTQNLLPRFISITIEKINYWMRLFAGVFIPNALIQIYTAYNIVANFLLHTVFHRISKFIFGKTSEFLEIQQNNNPKEFTPAVPRNISKANLEKLLAEIKPTAKPTMPGTGIEQDLKNLLEELTKFHAAYPAIKRRQEAYAAFVTLKTTPGILPKLKYYLGYIPMNISWYVTSMIYNPRLPAKFLDAKLANNQMAIDVSHMGYAPRILPPAPQVDFTKFLKQVTDSNLNSSASIFKAACLESPKFRGINTALKEKIENLIDEKNKAESPQEREKFAQDIDAEYTLLVNAWRAHFKIAADAPEEDIFSAYIQLRLTDICKRIETGKDLAWDKSTKSKEEIQTVGKHTIKHCQNLLEQNNTFAAHSLICTLTIDSGDYCAKAMSTVLDDLYERNVIEVLLKEYPITLHQKIALHMKYYRKAVAGYLYNTFIKQDFVKALFFHMDFEDVHDNGYIFHALRALHLDNNTEMTSDISNDNTDVLKEISSRIFAHTVTGILMTCEQGYSIEGIVASITNQFNKPNDRICPEIISALACFNEWVDSFNNAELKDYIEDIKAMAFIDDQEKEKLNKLFTLMLLDTGVFKFNKEEEKQKFDQLLLAASKEEPIPTTSSPVATIPNVHPMPAPAAMTNKSIIFSPVYRNSDTSIPDSPPTLELDNNSDSNSDNRSDNNTPDSSPTLHALSPAMESPKL